MSSLTGFETIGLLSNCSLPRSGVFQYILDVYRTYWKGESISGDFYRVDAEDPLPQNFAYRVLLLRVSDLRTSCHDPCKYHRHESEAGREASMSKDQYKWYFGILT